MIKRIILYINLLIFVFGYSITFANQIDPMNLPILTQPVTDFANVLNSEQLNSLNTIALDYEQKSTNQLITVIIPHRNGNELFDIGMKVFKNNKFGQEGKNNGILLVISSEEKKIRIITGYGMEGKFPDILARNIIEQNIRPFVNSSDYYNGILNFYNKSIDTLSGTGVNENMSSNSTKITTPRLIFIAVIFGFVGLIHVVTLFISGLIVISMGVSEGYYTLLWTYASILVGGFIILYTIFGKKYLDFFKNLGNGKSDGDGFGGFYGGNSSDSSGGWGGGGGGDSGGGGAGD